MYVLGTKTSPLVDKRELRRVLNLGFGVEANDVDMEAEDESGKDPVGVLALWSSIKRQNNNITNNARMSNCLI